MGCSNCNLSGFLKFDDKQCASLMVPTQWHYCRSINITVPGNGAEGKVSAGDSFQSCGQCCDIAHTKCSPKLEPTARKQIQFLRYDRRQHIYASFQEATQLEIIQKYFSTHHVLRNPKIFQDTSHQMDEVFK